LWQLLSFKQLSVSIGVIKMNTMKVRLIRLVFDLLSCLTRGHLSPLVSVGVIVEEHDRFLLINRSDGLGYSVPGGLMKWNETLEEAVKREVEEETGYCVTVKDFVGVYDRQKRDPRFRCLLHVYTATIVSGKGRPSREGKPAWIAKNNLPGKFAFDNGLVLTDYLSKVHNHSCASYFTQERYLTNERPSLLCPGS
jgi:ADP-ribose pyrophosphatase YjhB (NUDIX family)